MPFSIVLLIVVATSFNSHVVCQTTEEFDISTSATTPLAVNTIQSTTEEPTPSPTTTDVATTATTNSTILTTDSSTTVTTINTTQLPRTTTMLSTDTSSDLVTNTELETTTPSIDPHVLPAVECICHFQAATFVGGIILGLVLGGAVIFLMSYFNRKTVQVSEIGH